MDCVSYNFCQYRGCHADNCEDCAEHHFSVKCCFECDAIYCGEHMLKMVVKHGEDEYCSECSDRAASQLSDCNDGFENWVNELEGKYGGDLTHHPLAIENTFAAAMQKRESLRQRCHAVGIKLSFKQKMFEKFEQKLQGYECDLVG